MTCRLILLARRWLSVTILLMCGLAAGPALHAAEVAIQRAELEATEEGYRLAASFGFDLTRGLEDAVTRGIPLYFTTDIELRRPRWYWFDQTTIRDARTHRLSYNVLTQRYYAGLAGSLQQSFSNLDDALALIRRPSRWLVADLNTLKSGIAYNMSVRMRLDVAQLPKPFQVHAINSSDWRLSSDWHTYTVRFD